MTQRDVSPACPPGATLRAFLAGRLAVTELEIIAAHLDSCGVCSDTLEKLSDTDDALVNELRKPVTMAYLSEAECTRAEALVKEVGGRVTSLTTPPTLPPSRNETFVPTPPLLGQLGQYELLEKLGAGGMGEVFKARHRLMNRLVALKVIHHYHASQPTFLRRFQREILVLSRLNHPNIIRAENADRDGERHFLVMEYVAGVSLADQVRHNGPMPIAQACDCIRQVALALQHAHDHGLVHRDVKPSNLLLTPDGQVKLLDLGLALVSEDSSGSRELTATGQVFGTFDYMAPEQWDDSHRVDIRADLYSLGCTLYFLLAGQVPFSGSTYGTATRKMMAHVADEAPSIQKHRPEVPDALVGVLNRLLAKMPSDRYATPAEVASAMERFTEPGAVPVAVVSPEGAVASEKKTEVEQAREIRHTAQPVATPHRSRSRWRARSILVTVGLTLAVLVVVNAAAFLLTTGRIPSGENAAQSPDLSLNGQPVDPASSPSGLNPALSPTVPPVVVKPSLVDLGPKKDVPPVPDELLLGNGQLAADVLKKVKDATAFLRVVFADGSTGTGSGFLGVEENILLTNAYVLGMPTPESRPPRLVEVVLNSGEANEQILAGQVLGVNRHSDLAVLRVCGTKVGEVPTIPPPLRVRPAKNVVETQKVYVFGFPNGERLSNEITVRESSVAALRRKDGVLVQVQVNGGIDPGNSGGPLVDTNGDVIGVAVSKIPGTSIGFAVPGERVLSVLNGEIVGVETDQAYEKDGEVVLPVTVRMMDPLRCVKNVSVEVWVGNGNPEVLVAVNGARAKLAYADGVASGDVVLPPLTAGEEYRLQATFTNGALQTEWAAAHVLMLKSPPVKRVPTVLLLRQKNAAQLLLLDSTSTRLIHDPDGSFHPVDIRMQERLQEKIAVMPQGATLTYTFSAFDVSFLVDKKEVEELKPLVQGLKQHFRLVNAMASQDGLGNLDLQPLGPADLQKLPKEAQTPVVKLYAQTLRLLDTLAVPLPPGGNVSYGYGNSWQAHRPLVISNGSSHETGDLEMTYTYQGTRKREGRDEAVITIEGGLRGVGALKDKMGGHLIGSAVLDLASGQAIQVDVVVHMDMTARSPLNTKAEVRSTGSLTLKLQRELE
jgi:serine/threonine protein kinase